MIVALTWDWSTFFGAFVGAFLALLIFRLMTK